MLQCVRCGSQFSTYPLKSNCEKCGGILEYSTDWALAGKTGFSGALSFWRYKQLLPPVRQTVSLGEGGTPLLKAERLARSMGLREVCLKDETRNPTHSYRDRAAALLTSDALDSGYKAMVCATNGNMGASLAAYSAKVGLICHIVVPKVVDVGKLAQMLAYDAIIREYGAIVDESIRKANVLAKESGWYQATAELNPLVVEAQKTIAYEICEQQGVPEWVVVPMGSGGTIYSLWKGFKELKKLGLTDTLPKLVGVQPEGCAPIVGELNKTKTALQNGCSPSTRALAVLVGEPLQAELAAKAVNESGGFAVTVSDSEILTAELQLAKFEGVFAEPASSATVAALKKLADQSRLPTDNVVTCLITGSGLKATDVLQALTKKQKTAGLGLEISTKEKILRVLNEKDTYGYDLWKQLGKIITRAAVYQHLNELDGKGLIASYEKAGKKFFRITEQGKKALEAIENLKFLL